MSATACSWCDSERILGNQADAGRPLTDSEVAGEFFATHAECRSKVDSFFAGLAARGVFVDVERGEPTPEAA